MIMCMVEVWVREEKMEGDNVQPGINTGTIHVIGRALSSETDACVIGK